MVIAFVERKPNFDLWLSGLVSLHKLYAEKHSWHSCKDTKMATPLDLCRGMSRPVNWYRYYWDVLRVTNMWACERAMWAQGFALDLSLYSGFVILCSQRWILVDLNPSTVAFIEIWGKCPCLFCMLTNTTLNHPWLWAVNNRGNSYISLVVFWLHLLIFIRSNIVGVSGKVLWTQDP